MSSALIAVDVQKDFLPGGALAVPEGDEVIQPLVMLSYEVDLTVATMDWHQPTHPSFKEVGGQWPMHCVAGSEGAVLNERIDYIADIIVRKGQTEEAYSGFQGTRLSQILQWYHNEEISDFEKILVGGLATEYCVAATAMDAKQFFPESRVIIVSDASRGIWNNSTEEDLLGHLALDGVEYLRRAEL